MTTTKHPTQTTDPVSVADLATLRQQKKAIEDGD